jgi:hypothetical protein
MVLAGCGVDIDFDDDRRGLIEGYDPGVGLDTGVGADADGEAGGSLAALEHVAWGGVLSLHHRGACMDYEGLAASPESVATLGRYIDQLARVDLDAVAGEERSALWINAYNAITVQGVLDARAEDPSFRADANSFAFFKVRRATVGGIVVSLDGLEHGILRGETARESLSGFDDAQKAAFLSEHAALGAFDPRVHFALNCASLSCPDLRGEPYLGVSLGEQLDDQSTRFLDNNVKGAGPDGISSLFSWFRADFESVAPVREFIGMYRTGGADDVDIGTYLEYEWALNDFDQESMLCR